MRKIREAEVAKNWNHFIKTLIHAETLWEQHRAYMAGVRQIEGLSPKARKVLAASTNRSKFEVALPRLVDQWRMGGGLKELIVDIPKNTKQKKDIKYAETSAPLKR